MLLRHCKFDTDRLQVRDSHSASLPAELVSNLPAIVAGVLTEKVTRALPAAWHGEFNPEHAQAFRMN